VIIQDELTVNSIPATSTAAVFREVGKPLSLEKFPIPQLRGGEVLARILCATICGSDLHSYYGRRPSPKPSVLGHEMVAEIQAVGPEGARDFNGNPLKIGDRITWSMVWSCGRCFFCRHGLRPKCEKLMKFGHAELTPDWSLSGGMAEHCHLPGGTAIFRVPENVPDAVATPSNCATATVAAAFRHAGSVDGQCVVIHGAGMLGQTACAMASLGGAAHVVVIEPDPARREKALQFGATEAIDSGLAEAEILARIKKLTEDRGADVGLEFSGHPGAVELGIRLLRPGGRLILAGSTFPQRPLRIDGEDLVRRLIQLIGVYNYLPEDLESALRFLSESVDSFPFETLVGRRFPLTAVNEAMDYAERERPPRVALLPQHED
jgi:alcohol dehydrogenase